MRKPAFCICENKGEDQLRSNCAADQRLCFRYTAQTLYFLNLKFQASCHLLWLHSPVCIRPGWKPQRQFCCDAAQMKLNGYISMHAIFEPQSRKTNIVVYVPSEDSDQPGHPTVTSRAYDLILYFCVTIPNYHQIRRVQTGGAGRIHWGKPLYLWNYVNQSWTAFTRLHRTYTELLETTFPPWTANGYTGHLKRAPILGMDQL